MSSVLGRLQADIIEAAQIDTLYAPQSDIVRHVNGPFASLGGVFSISKSVRLS
jgi:hypothetical protein